MKFPKELKYTKTHEWARREGGRITVGITDYAQKEISDVVFVELPKVNQGLKQKDSAMVIESVKAAFDIYAPVSGKVIKVNDILKDKPQLVNQSPYENGWLFQIECSNPEEWDSLLGEEDYRKSAAH